MSTTAIFVFVKIYLKDVTYDYYYIILLFLLKLFSFACRLLFFNRDSSKNAPTTSFERDTAVLLQDSGTNMQI